MRLKSVVLSLTVVGAMLAPLFYAAPAQAQATRTWVSGVGDDANPCSRTAPCKTWAGAIVKTAAGGEIDNLDAGGFGALTITKSITLDGGGGAVASTLVSGTNGIVIAAGASDVVIIRNIRFQGLLGNGSSPGTAGINGISYTSGAQVVIDNCDIYGFNTSGINVALSTSGFMEIRNTTLRNNATGVGVTSSSGFAVVQMVNSSVVGTNTSGTSSQGGVTAGTGGAVSIFNSNFQDLTFGAQVQSGGVLNVDSSFFSSAINGVLTAGGTTANVSNNSFYNGTAFGGSGTFNSAKNNKIGGTQGSTNITSMNIQ